jgi:hypothetical protein
MKLFFTVSNIWMCRNLGQEIPTETDLRYLVVENKMDSNSLSISFCNNLFLFAKLDINLLCFVHFRYQSQPLEK